MNANELADNLKKYFITEGYWESDLIEMAETMLRQQADRIGVLEANHKIQLNINEKALQYIEQLEQGLRASIDLNNAQAKRAQGK